MDGFIRGVGLVLRFPFFLVGLAVTATYSAVAGLLLSVWTFVVCPLVWVVFGIPLAFFSIAFKGSGSGTTQLQQRLEKDIEAWKRTWTYRYKGIGGLFDGLTKWLIRGSA